jgi:hypothetical protein
MPVSPPSPVELARLGTSTPYQLTMHPSQMERFSEGRKAFNALEWIDLLLESVGYNPASMETTTLPPPGTLYDTGRTYDTGQTRDTGRRTEAGDKILEPVMAPVMEPVVYDTGKKDKKKQPVMALVWEKFIVYDEETEENVQVKDELGQPIWFHRPDVKRKLLMLCRLLPLAMRNYHLAEIGPRNTGKSYFLPNLSPAAYVIPAGKITSAQLIYSNQRGNEKPGVLGVYKVAILDDAGEKARWSRASVRLSRTTWNRATSPGVGSRPPGTAGSSSRPTSTSRRTGPARCSPRTRGSGFCRTS